MSNLPPLSVAVAQAVLRNAVEPALRLLPLAMNTPLARVHLLAIGLQESQLVARRQFAGGPARGLWQFELGGGVRGVYQHHVSREHLRDLCAVRGVKPVPAAIYAALEHDDIFAAGVARLLLWTDRMPLPDTRANAWEMYANRLWKPGRPHPETWAACWDVAQHVVGVASDGMD